MSRSVLHIDSFIDWVAAQPPGGWYWGANPHRCVLAQYARSWGGRGSTPDFMMIDLGGASHSMQDISPLALHEVLFPSWRALGFSTFGGLHDRLCRWRVANAIRPTS